MNQGNRLIKVMGRDGLLGWINPHTQPTDSPDIQVQLEDGRTLLVPAGFFLEQEGGYYLPLSGDQLHQAEIDQQRGGRRESLMVVPIIAEQAEVQKRRVTTGRVRLHKRVHERQETVDAERIREKIEVTRVPVDRPVDKAPTVHYEGDTMIIPVLEEVLFVEKRLVLREEIRVRKIRETVSDPQNVTLRSEEIDIERIKEQEKSQED